MSLSQVVKQLAMEAFESSAPVKIVFGKVTKANPLEIYLDSKLTIKEANGQIKVTRQVTDYETEITPIDWYTETTSGGGATYEAFATHKHDINGKKKVKIHNSLKIGDIAVLLRMQGGQVFVVIDKIGEGGTGSNEGTGGSGGSGGNDTSYAVYEGSYTVTSSSSSQTLPTKNKVMLDDVTIGGMPYEESNNDGGGTTVSIGQKE